MTSEAMFPSEAREVVRREMLKESCGEDVFRKALFVLDLDSQMRRTLDMEAYPWTRLSG